MIHFIKYSLLLLRAVISSAFIGTAIYSIRNFNANFTQFSFHVELFLECWAWAFGGVIILGLIALTPVGETLVSLFLPMRKRSMREAETMDAAVSLVEGMYKKKYGKGLKLKAFVEDIPDVNGYAFGNCHIVLSRGTLKVADEDEIAAVVAHEVGHLHHNDGKQRMLIMSMELAVILIYAIFEFLAVSRDDEGGRRQDDGFTLKAIIGTAILYLMPYFVLSLYIQGFLARFLNFMESTIRWPKEYRADAFATQLGFGEDLIAVLEYFEEQDVRMKAGFFNRYDYTHPPTALRIDRIERLMLE